MKRMGILFCKSDEEPDDSLCACCNGAFVAQSNRHLCKGGCETVNHMKTLGITYNGETNKWHAENIGHFFYHDQAVTAVTLQGQHISQRRPRRRSTRGRYTAFVHKDTCIGDEIRINNVKQKKSKVCKLCSAWYNYNGGRAAPLGKERIHCVTRQRLENEKNGIVYARAESVPSPTTTHDESGEGEGESERNSTRMVPSVDQEDNKCSDELQQSFQSALELEKYADRMASHHPGRATAYRVALNSYIFTNESIVHAITSSSSSGDSNELEQLSKDCTRRKNDLSMKIAQMQHQEKEKVDNKENNTNAGSGVSSASPWSSVHGQM